jgi:tetratricopeptide (TPR) repeat protein
VVYYVLVLVFSACYAALSDWANAAEDGRSCIVTDRNFVKGYFRLALALQSLKDFDGASEAVKRGLGIDSTNADLKRMSREIDEGMRKKKVENAMEQAENQLAAQDAVGAYKTCDGALRLDPTNEALSRLMGRIRPVYERAEKNRVAGLDKKERMKEEGDTRFKAANFEGAIESYSKALEYITDKVIQFNELYLHIYCRE